MCIDGDVGLFGEISVFWLKGWVSDAFSRDTYALDTNIACVGRKNEERKTQHKR